MLDHTSADANTVIRKDIRAPIVEFTFDLQKDSSKTDEVDQSVKILFNKVQLQSMFEELEKIQLKLDDLTN